MQYLKFNINFRNLGNNTSLLHGWFVCYLKTWFSNNMLITWFSNKMSLGHGLLFLFGLFVLMISFLLKKLFLFSFFFLFLFLSSLLERRKYINIKLKQDYSIPKDFMLHKLLFPQGSGNLHSTHPIDNRNPLCREKLVLFFFLFYKEKKYHGTKQQNSAA